MVVHGCVCKVKLRRGQTRWWKMQVVLHREGEKSMMYRENQHNKLHADIRCCLSG